MKKQLIIGLMVLGFGVFGSSAIVYSNVSAQSDEEESINITNRQTINKSIVTGASTVEIDGQLNGDLFCLSQDLTISGTVNGDVICLTSKANITGEINGSLRLLASETYIDGQVFQNSTIVTDKFVLEKSGYFGIDLFLTATNSQVDGIIERDLNLYGQNYTVGGTVKRDISGFANQLKLEKVAKINGNINLTSQNKIQTDESVFVGGVIKQTEGSSIQSNLIVRNLMFSLLLVFSLVVVALAIAFLMPKTLEYSHQVVKNRPLKVPLAGLIVSILTPILIAILFITVIGIPLALLLIALYIAISFFTGPLVAYQIGKLIQRKKKQKPMLTMLIGSAVLLVIYLIPILNLFAISLSFIYGLGIIALMIKNRVIGKI